MKTILSLFDHSGAWSKPYLEAGYSVERFDLKRGRDVLHLWQDVRNGLWSERQVHGILAAPPCTDFSGSGAQYWPAKDANGTTAASLRLIDATLGIVRMLKPKWWAMENPAGRLNRLRPELKEEGPVYFHPWEFAGYQSETPEWTTMLEARDAVDAGGRLTKAQVQAVIDCGCYTKRTGLWGDFQMPFRNSFTPIRCSTQGSWTQLLGGKSERTKELRSITPAGFARAFFLFNP